MLCMFTFRCVSVRCADLLIGPVVHLPVHSGSHVSVLSQTAQRKRYRVLFDSHSVIFFSTRASLNPSIQLSFLSLFFFFFSLTASYLLVKCPESRYNLHSTENGKL